MENIKEIIPIKKLDAQINSPPSKAHTIRSLFFAALGEGRTTIINPLLGKDQRVAIQALKDLGASIALKENKIYVDGANGKFKPAKENIYIENSGITARILAVVGALSDKEIIMDGNDRMRKGRPLQDLLDAARPLGIKAESIKGNGCPPIRIENSEFTGGETKLKGSKSSQYFSALLMAAPFAENDCIIKTEGELMSKPYVDITIDMMKDFGCEVRNENYKEFVVKAKQKYKSREYRIEGDYSAASFFFAAAAITRGKIRINNLYQKSAQGDKRFVDFLEMMGCSVSRGADWVELEGKPLKGIRVDMGDYPDIVIPLAVVSAFAEGKTEIFNISHLKYKESDRIRAPVAELKKMGINAQAYEDKMVIEGGNPGPAEIDTYKDHRMVMSFAVAGLKVPGIKIREPENCQKSFPDFFEVLEGLR